MPVRETIIATDKYFFNIKEVPIKETPSKSFRGECFPFALLDTSCFPRYGFAYSGRTDIRHYGRTGNVSNPRTGEDRLAAKRLRLLLVELYA